MSNVILNLITNLYAVPFRINRILLPNFRYCIRYNIDREVKLKQHNV